MKSPALRVGDRVRLLADYRLPIPSETLPLPAVRKGSQGTVVKRSKDSLWVQVDGVSTPLPFWEPGAFPEDFAKTTSLRRVGAL
jgi:hypothetical protein